MAAPGVRWSELMAAISLATDIGMAQPLETGLATCLVAIALADRVGASEQDLIGLPAGNGENSP